MTNGTQLDLMLFQTTLRLTQCCSGERYVMFKWYLVFLLCLFVFHHYPVINKTVNHNKFRFGYIVTFMLVFKQYFGFKWRHCTTVHFFVYSKSKLFLFVGNPFCSFILLENFSISWLWLWTLPITLQIFKCLKRFKYLHKMSWHLLYLSVF